MAFTRYEGAGQVYLSNQLLAEAKRVRMRIASNDSRVTTMLKGLGGWSDGATSVDGSIDSAVPKAGFEADYFQLVEDKAEFTLVVVIAGKRRAFSCRFSDAEGEISDSGPASATANFEGKPAGGL